MFPHIYHGYIPNSQQQIIKAKIGHYGYHKDPNQHIGEVKVLQSFDPKQNSNGMTLTNNTE